MSIKKLYELSLMFSHDLATRKTLAQTKKDVELIKEFLDFIMKSRRDEYLAKGSKKWSF